MSTVEGFGDPKHGVDRKGFPEGLKDGVQEHRILPPILSQRETGKYVRDHSCHYGYGVKMNNSDKELPNPFYCVENGKFVAGKFVVLQECPECRLIKQVKSQKEAIEADMKRAGNSDEEISAATASHSKWLSKHNRDFKYYVNVKGGDGRYFTVKYPSKKVWKVIEAAISKAKSSTIPVDAIAASQGLIFRITRSGKGFKTDYSVEVVTEDVVINGQVVPGAQKLKLAPLTAEDAKKAGEACLDLSDVGIRHLSVEQVERLASSKGDPSIIQAIFAGSDPVSQVQTREEEEEASPEIAQIAVATPAPVVVPNPVVENVPAPVTAPPVHNEAADLVAQARKLMEQAKALSAAPVAQVAQPPVDNEHVAAGCEQFKPEVVKANQVPVAVTQTPVVVPVVVTPSPKQEMPNPATQVKETMNNADEMAFLAQFQLPG